MITDATSRRAETRKPKHCSAGPTTTDQPDQRRTCSSRTWPGAAQIEPYARARTHTAELWQSLGVIAASLETPPTDHSLFPATGSTRSTAPTPFSGSPPTQPPDAQPSSSAAAPPTSWANDRQQVRPPPRLATRPAAAACQLASPSPCSAIAQPRPAANSWIRPDGTGHWGDQPQTAFAQVRWHLTRWWQVLGSNQRRLSRRFYRPLPLATRATCLGRPCGTAR